MCLRSRAPRTWLSPSKANRSQRHHSDSPLAPLVVGRQPPSISSRLTSSLTKRLVATVEGHVASVRLENCVKPSRGGRRRDRPGVGSQGVREFASALCPHHEHIRASLTELSAEARLPR